MSSNKVTILIIQIVLKNKIQIVGFAILSELRSSLYCILMMLCLYLALQCIANPKPR